MSLILIALSAALAAQVPSDPRALLDRAVVEFERGRITESVARFDELVKISPQVMPQLWQRGRG